MNIELPKALEERIKELVKAGFYSSHQEFVIEAVRTHLNNQKFKELERIAEKWVNYGIYRIPYWDENGYYHYQGGENMLK